MRLVVVLAVAAAATVMLGAILVAVSVVMRHLGRPPPAHLARIGLYAVTAGIAFGLVVLVLFAIGRIGRGGRSRPRTAAAGHRRGGARPRAAAQVQGSTGQGSTGQGSTGQGSAGNGSAGNGSAGRSSVGQGSGGRSRGRGRGGSADGGHGGHGGRGGGRSGRPPVLDPTNVITPGGLIDVPRDGQAPGAAGSQPIPEILRTADPVPEPPGPGAWGQDRPPSGWAGPQPPRAGYQPGMNPAGPGRAPYGPGGAPVPPRDHMRPRSGQAAPGHPMPGYAAPGQAMPGRDGVPRPAPGPGAPPRGAAPPHQPPHQPPGPRPGQAGPPREPGQFRDGMPREGMGPGGPAGFRGPGRHGAPPPPRDPAYPPPPGPGYAAGYGPGQATAYGPGPAYGPRPAYEPGPAYEPRSAYEPGPAYEPRSAYEPGPAYEPGQGGGAGRHAGGPGHAAPGGRRPGGPYQGPSEPAGQFDGGYATVIRASDSPVRPARRPGSGRPADSARPDSGRLAQPPGEAPADVFVYRDPDDQPARVPGENDPSYWYDLTGNGSAGAGIPVEETPHVIEEIRGPFEPLVSSADPPGTVRAAAGPAPADPEVAGPVSHDDVTSAGAPARDDREDVVHAHARKLEQIKDLYLTAEAIGEANVDKHFDQLLAQQRELISEYFRQSSSASEHGAADQAGDGPGASGDLAPPAGGPELPADAPENAPVAADQPRAW